MNGTVPVSVTYNVVCVYYCSTYTRSMSQLILSEWYVIYSTHIYVHVQYSVPYITPFHNMYTVPFHTRVTEYEMGRYDSVCVCVC